MKKLIEVLNKVIDCDKCGIVAEWLADDLTANGVTMQKWVSVTERLPKVGEEVLVYCAVNNTYKVGAYSDTYRAFFVGQFAIENITHWMDLPKAPTTIVEIVDIK